MSTSSNSESVDILDSRSTPDQQSTPGGTDPILTSNVDAYDVLMDLCREKKSGIILQQTKKDDYPLFVCIDYTWSEEECAEFDAYRKIPLKISDLEDFTPLLLLDYFKIEWLTDSTPAGLQKKEMTRVMGGSNFLAILDAYPLSQCKVPHTRFVVPSDMLPRTNDLQKYDAEKLELSDGMLIIGWGVSHEYLHETIFGLLEGHESVRFGHAQREIKTGSYLTTFGVWREIVEGEGVEACKVSPDAISRLDQPNDTGNGVEA